MTSSGTVKRSRCTTTTRRWSFPTPLDAIVVPRPRALREAARARVAKPGDRQLVVRVDLPAPPVVRAGRPPSGDLQVARRPAASFGQKSPQDRGRFCDL